MLKEELTGLLNSYSWISVAPSLAKMVGRHSMMYLISSFSYRKHSL